MRLYQKILAYTFMTAAGLGMIGCDQSSYQSKPVEVRSKPVEPRYISGTVKSENFKRGGILEIDTYCFTLSTEDGLKMFEASGYAAQKMDGLLDPKDAVKFKIDELQKNNKDNFSVRLEDITEINGKPFFYDPLHP